MRLAGQAAVVTGSSKGIGRAVALALARDGCDVVVNGMDRDAVTLVAQEVERLGRRPACRRSGSSP